MFMPSLVKRALLTPDNCVVETYDADMDVVKKHCGAYGIGVECAHTIVHDAPPTEFPEYTFLEPYHA